MSAMERIEEIERNNKRKTGPYDLDITYLLRAFKVMREIAAKTMRENLAEQGHNSDDAHEYVDAEFEEAMKEAE